MTRDQQFPAFCEAVRKLIEETAAAKGYHQSGLAGIR